MLALHIDTLLFILFIGMAVLLRLLASKAGNANKQSQGPEEESRPTFTPPFNQPIERAPEETDADRIRKFLEALGQPTTSKPPPPAVPRTDIPPRPVAPVRPPPGLFPIPTAVPRPFAREEWRKRRVILPQGGAGAAPLLPPQRDYAGEIAPASTKPTFAPPVSEVPGFQVEEKAPPPEPPPQILRPAETYAIATQPVTRIEQRKTDIVVLLGSASGLRSAMILREIFGPPRSLQPLDVIGSP